MAEKILLVDDDHETLRLVRLMLERKGYQVTAAMDGMQALQLAAAQKPDIILLDIMMPNMDGYEVTRRLRSDPKTAQIPILIFTAKSQPDDQANGYDNGADDFLTKPTHPEELTAHIKALLARPPRDHSLPLKAGRGHVTAFLSAKGGVGTSTLALNTGIALQNHTHNRVILAEFRPGYGSWGLELGYTGPGGLNNLVSAAPESISYAAVERELVNGPSGVRLLLASSNPGDNCSPDPTSQYHAILSQLARMAPKVLVDLGANLLPGSNKMLRMCDEVVVVVDPHPITVTRSRLLVDHLAALGFGQSKRMAIALVNRVRTDVMMSWSQVQEALGQPVSVILAPAPELAFQSALRNTPMIGMQAGSLQAQQYEILAEMLAKSVKE